MFTMPFSPSLRQLESAWRDLWADPLVHTRYNAGLLTLEEVRTRYLDDYLVCLSLGDHWTILNWFHDIVPIEGTRMYAGWSGGWVSHAARGPQLEGLRKSIHNDVVNRFYRSLGVAKHGAAVIQGNLAGERHTLNIGYHPIGWAPDFAKVSRVFTNEAGREVLVKHSLWCWDEDDARFIWRLGMERSQGPQVAFEERELITV